MTMQSNDRSKVADNLPRAHWPRPPSPRPGTQTPEGRPRRHRDGQPRLRAVGGWYHGGRPTAPTTCPAVFTISLGAYGSAALAALPVSKTGLPYRLTGTLTFSSTFAGSSTLTFYLDRVLALSAFLAALRAPRAASILARSSSLRRLIAFWLEPLRTVAGLRPAAPAAFVAYRRPPPAALSTGPR